MRGYCGIGVYHPKKEVNVGTLWRSAASLGADFIFTIGQRYRKQCSDTTKAYLHLPLWHFEDYTDFRNHIPYDCQVIAVELADSAHPLKNFPHPERAIYLLGAEDYGLPETILETCQATVQIESARCLNVAVAGSIILYDRQQKGNK